VWTIFTHEAKQELLKIAINRHLSSVMKVASEKNLKPENTLHAKDAKFLENTVFREKIN